MRQKIFWNFRNLGFGSCFNLTVLAYVYAQHHGCDFVLFSKDSNICVKNGWTDYFLPFSEPQNIDYNSLGINDFLPGKTVWNSKFTRQKSIKLNNKQFKGNCFAACQVIAKEIWHFNKEVKTCIDNKIKALNLPEQYICLHIRRGDKLHEAGQYAFPDVSQYIELYKNKSNITDYFVMTDDVSVIAELENKYRNYRFYTLADTQTGFNIEAFNNSNKQFRYNSIIALLTDIEIAKKANMFIGTYTSNIFRLVSLFKPINQMQAIDCEYDKLFNRFHFNLPERSKLHKIKSKLYKIKRFIHKHI